MILLDCCCWQNAIAKIPCLCWGVIGLVALYLVLKYVVQPCMASCHERKVKEESFRREKFWAFYKRVEEPLEDELKKVRDELAELKNKERDLNEGQTALKKEKEEQGKIILEEKIKVYQEIIKETK